jgi:DNA-binding transcriptional MerR regulator
MMKIGELARRINTPPNTLRYWCKEYGQHLSDGAKVGGLGTVRNLSEKDALILATIADLRSKGLNREQIVEVIENEHLIESLPDEKTAEEREAQKSVALIPHRLSPTLDQIRSCNLRSTDCLKSGIRLSLAATRQPTGAETQHELGRARYCLRRNRCCGGTCHYCRGRFHLAYSLLATAVVASLLPTPLRLLLDTTSATML